jgi:hypothetical protein
MMLRVEWFTLFLSQIDFIEFDTNAGKHSQAMERECDVKFRYYFFHSAEKTLSYTPTVFYIKISFCSRAEN